MRLARPQVRHLAANNYRMDAYILSQTPTCELGLHGGRQTGN